MSTNCAKTPEGLSPSAQAVFMQAMADAGLPLPHGVYQFDGTVIKIPADYQERARAAGRTDEEEDGVFLYATGCGFMSAPGCQGGGIEDVSIVSLWGDRRGQEEDRRRLREANNRIRERMDMDEV